MKIMVASHKGTIMRVEQDDHPIVDAVIAGSAVTMPLWAVNLNGWLHLFMALGGSILIAYRLWVIFKPYRDD
jgi:hypothetical protein